MTAPQQQPSDADADAGTSAADPQPAQDAAAVAGSAADPAPQSEAALQEEIQQAREELGETVTALTAKLDVKDRIETRASRAAKRVAVTARRARVAARRRLLRSTAAARQHWPLRKSP